MEQKKIYLAGPLGFSESGTEFHQKSVIKQLEEEGFKTLDPWQINEELVKQALSTNTSESWHKANLELGENNKKAIDECDIVYANLDGADVDSGTAAEIGYAFAKSKIIIGSRSDFRLSSENIYAPVNVQVYYFIKQSGGEVYKSFKEAKEQLRKFIKQL